MSIEKQIIKLFNGGHSVKDIAIYLGIDPRMAERVIRNHSIPPPSVPDTPLKGRIVAG